VAAQQGRTGKFVWSWREHREQTAYARRITSKNLTDEQANGEMSPTNGHGNNPPDPPPASTDPALERALLAALLRAPSALAASLDLRPEDLHHPPHARLLAAMHALAAQGTPCDPVLLRSTLGPEAADPLLRRLSDAPGDPAAVPTYAARLGDLARGRRLAAALTTALEQLARGAPPGEVGARVAAALDRDRTGDVRPVGADLPALFEVAWRRVQGQERPLSTPWPPVNAVLGGAGLWPGMYVLVGGTGAGKTQWALQLAVHAAQTGARVLYLALELSRQDLAARIVGAAAGVPWSDFLLGKLTPDATLDVIGRTERAVQDLPLYTECAPPYGYAAETLAARARALRPALVVLDYLQLCGGTAGEDPRVSAGRVAYVARALARDLNTVVLVLSSTARANYKDLIWTDDRDAREFVGFGKESGEIEYAADGVLVLAHAQDPASPRRTLVVAKHRTGPTGAAPLHWTGTRFTPPDDDPAPASGATGWEAVPDPEEQERSPWP
jgi:replicative DNA helicase